MSFAATIMARLGLDTKPFSDNMRGANKDVDVHTKSIGNASRAHDRLFTSGHRAARQFSGFTKELLSTGNAANVAGSALEAMGRSLNLSLGGLAALEVGGVVISQAAKLREEFKKLHDQVTATLDEIGNGPIEFHSLSQLEAHLEKINKLTEDLRSHGAGIDRGFFGSIWQGIKYGMALYSPSGAVSEEDRNERGLASADAQSHATRAAIAAARRRKNAGKNDPYAQFDPRNNDEYLESATPGSSKENQLLAEVIAEELKNGLIDLIHKIMSKAEEKTKLSLSDLASGPGFGDQNHASLKAIYDAEQARRSIGLDQQGDDLMKNQGDYAGAFSMHSQAEQIRNGISGLKDSEKTRVFQDALDASQRLKQIEENTGRGIVNR